MSSNNCVMILAGGNGNRIKSEMPKPMLTVLDEPMIDWVITACKRSSLTELCVVSGYKNECIEDYICGKYPIFLQKERKGTGHAVMMAADFLKEHIESNVLVLCGDAPFIDEETINNALTLHSERDNAVTVITSIMEDSHGYGRIVRGKSGISAIVEEKDATDEQKKIKEINSGAYWFKVEALLDALEKITPNNSQGEYYLTDTVFILLNNGLRADAYISPNPEVVLGANDKKDLLMLNTIARKHIIDRHIENGVEFSCTDGIIIGRNVKIGAGTAILPGTILRGNTLISESCVIGPNCLIDDCIIGYRSRLNYVQAYQSSIGDDVTVGPFVHIRPNSIIKSDSKIGDFVEIKNSIIGEKTSIPHLSYIGDSDVGRHVNFGCGCVTVNYDGQRKSRTTVGDNAFVGCQSKMIAPVNIGNGAYIAAGTTVTKDVPDNCLAIDRGELRFKENYAPKKLKDRNRSL